MAVGDGDFTDTIVDLEAGIIVTKLPTSQPTLALPDGTPLRTSTLPKVEAVTGTRTGLPELSSGFYAGLGRWLTANNAHISGPVSASSVASAYRPARQWKPGAARQVEVWPAARQP